MDKEYQKLLKNKVKKIVEAGIGIELKDKYFETAVKNVNKVVEKSNQIKIEF